MKRVLLCFREQHNGSYVGGILTIIRSYLSHKMQFQEQGIDIKLFSYQPSNKWDTVNSKIANVAYIFQQRHALKKYLKDEKDLILNIHTSREFLFLKDVLLGEMAFKKKGVSVVLTIHVGDISTVFNRISFLKKHLIHIMNKNFAKVIFLTEKIRTQFIDAGLESEKTEVLYNFHDLKQSSKNLQRSSKVYFMFMGAIHREKGIIELLNALIQLQDIDFHCDICGVLTDQTIKEEYYNLLNALGNKAEEHGYVSGEEKTLLLQRADVFILPSYHEGMPLVILEALSQGCALIATAVGGTSEILSDENVRWVDVQSSENIKQEIIKLVEDDKLLDDMKKANAELGEKYSIESHIKLLCNIYEDIFKQQND